MIGIRHSAFGIRHGSVAGGRMSGPVRSFRDLDAWKRAYEMSLAVYELTSSFPGDEKFGLVSQVRRSAVSVVSNIAEGYGRGTEADYVRFLRLARGSLCEVEAQLLIAQGLGYGDRAQLDGCLEMQGRAAMVLAGLIRSLSGSSRP